MHKIESRGQLGTPGRKLGKCLVSVLKSLTSSFFACASHAAMSCARCAAVGPEAAAGQALASAPAAPPR